MGLLDRGPAMLNRALGVAAGASVTYTRGATSLPLTAEVGRTVFRSAAAAGGVRLEWGDRDYVIPAAALTLGEPAEGDRVAETVNGVACVFEVQRPDTGEPAWRFSDPTRTAYRLHVKQVG